MANIEKGMNWAKVTKVARVLRCSLLGVRRRKSSGRESSEVLDVDNDRWALPEVSFFNIGILPLSQTFMHFATCTRQEIHMNLQVETLEIRL